MVANIRCAEIAAEQVAALLADQAWRAVGQEAEAGLVPAFGARVGDLVSSTLIGASPPLG